MAIWDWLLNEGKEFMDSVSDSVSNIIDGGNPGNAKKRNGDYFLDNQYNNLNTTWRLHDSSGEVMRGILLDDTFGFSVNHSYGELGGVGGVIANTLNTMGSGIRTVDEGTGLLQTIVGTIGDNTNNDSLKSLSTKVDGGLKEFDNFLGQRQSWLGGMSFKDAAWGQFISAISQVKTFNGTNITINIPTLKMTYFENDDGLSTITRVKNLNKKFIGEYKNYEGTLGLLQAPNGYRPDFSKLDPVRAKFDGTFTLYLGTSYKITNLVVTGYNAEFSTIKHRTTENPLYVDVSVSVDIASYVDRNKLNDCIIKF